MRTLSPGRLCVLAGSLVLLGVTGCGRPRVAVKDPAGNPVPGARVKVKTVSIASEFRETDGGGMVTLPREGIQPWRWVYVTKEGFHPVEKELGDPTSPAVVVLQPFVRRDGAQGLRADADGARR